MPTPTIFHLGALAGATSLTAARIKEIRTLGFSGLIVSLPDLACIAPQPALVERVAKLARLCHSEELVLLCELELFNLDPSHPLVAAQPELFALRPSFSGGIVDPRQRDRPQGRALLRTERPIAAVVEFWAEVIGVLRRAGCGGFCLRQSGGLGPALCARLIADAGKTLWIADATAQDWARMLQLRGCGFDHVLGSLPWWDYRHSWFVEEHALLSGIAPVMSHVESWQKLPPLRTQARCARLAVAALAGVGLLLPAGFVGMSEAEDRQQQLLACIRAANRYVSETGATRRRLSQRTGPCAPVTILLSTSAADNCVALINPDPLLATAIGAEQTTMLGDFQDLVPIAPFAGDGGVMLRPGEARLCQAGTLPLVHALPSLDVHRAFRLPRLTIDHVTPDIAPGLALKRIIGEWVQVEADILTDGHPVISADLIHRAEDERSWQRVPMQLLDNDRWCAQFALRRLGRHRFAIEAWIDGYGSLARDLGKMRDAGLELDLEVEEGRSLIADALEAANGAEADVLKASWRALGQGSNAERLAVLLAPQTIEVMRCCQPRQHLTLRAGLA